MARRRADSVGWIPMIVGGTALAATGAIVLVARLGQVAAASMPRVWNEPRYAPRSEAQIALFEEAAARAGLPPSWARSAGLVEILSHESDGWVGRPNYTYGQRAKDRAAWPSIWAELRRGDKSARSSATGLGQLLLSNVDRYYPRGRAGIGDALDEAMGMLRYIHDRYGAPERAWALYGTLHEGY